MAQIVVSGTRVLCCWPLWEVRRAACRAGVVPGSWDVWEAQNRNQEPRLRR